jgi:hypothetical protein
MIVTSNKIDTAAWVFVFLLRCIIFSIRHVRSRVGGGGADREAIYNL